MDAQRSHEVITDDGVAIRATVLGQGPPLVLLQGVMGDGDVDWRALAPLLATRFTCHMPSMRGRGRSDDHPNVQLDRISADYAAYIESLGEPTALVGWSAGAGHALGLASRLDAVAATASYEPVASMLMNEDDRAALIGSLGRGRELVEQGDLPGAMRAIAAFPFTPDDIAAADDAGYFEATARYTPHLLEVFAQLADYRGRMPEEPEVLGAIRAPVLVLHGSQTGTFMQASAQHVIDHVRDARAVTIPGAGHTGPLTHPEAIAEQLFRFFEPVFADG
ncbi:alpha/beta hydrolase [Agrococcus sp. ProA11]|uniref:alpha/beta fold hydrolase n=1 Tax=Agrococcus chionoecetis TaxID=3153752 RepID=UPI003261283C